jgi:hypothetical protein
LKLCPSTLQNLPSDAFDARCEHQRNDIAGNAKD